MIKGGTNQKKEHGWKIGKERNNKVNFFCNISLSIQTRWTRCHLIG